MHVLIRSALDRFPFPNDLFTNDSVHLTILNVMPLDGLRLGCILVRRLCDG